MSIAQYLRRLCSCLPFPRAHKTANVRIDGRLPARASSKARSVDQPSSSSDTGIDKPQSSAVIETSYNGVRSETEASAQGKSQPLASPLVFTLNPLRSGDILEDSARQDTNGLQNCLVASNGENVYCRAPVPQKPESFETLLDELQKLLYGLKIDLSGTATVTKGSKDETGPGSSSKIERLHPRTLSDSSPTVPEEFKKPHILNSDMKKCLPVEKIRQLVSVEGSISPNLVDEMVRMSCGSVGMALFAAYVFDTPQVLNMKRLYYLLKKATGPDHTIKDAYDILMSNNRDWDHVKAAYQLFGPPGIELEPGKVVDVEMYEHAGFPLLEPAKYIGLGSSGTVWQIKLRTNWGDRRFAIKKLNDRKRKEVMQTCYEVESSMAGRHTELGTRHCMFLNATIRRGKDRYLLMPLGHENLTSYMGRTRPQMTPEREDWVVKQILGLITTTWQHQSCQVRDVDGNDSAVHRDIKPANVLIVFEGEDLILPYEFDELEKLFGSLFLIDFGISKMKFDNIDSDEPNQHSEDITDGGTSFGWAAPEVFEGRNYSRKSDVFSLCAVSFELIISLTIGPEELKAFYDARRKQNGPGLFREGYYNTSTKSIVDAVGEWEQKISKRAELKKINRVTKVLCEVLRAVDREARMGCKILEEKVANIVYDQKPESIKEEENFTTSSTFSSPQLRNDINNYRVQVGSSSSAP